jgi:hypothetical protein
MPGTVVKLPDCRLGAVVIIFYKTNSIELPLISLFDSSRYFV